MTNQGSPTSEGMHDQDRFKCRQCRLCCMQSGFVFLSGMEADAIAAYLDMDIYRFVDTFCDIVNRSQLVLKENQDRTCVFLSASGCRVYPARPKQCRDFPLKWKTDRSASYCEGLKAMGGQVA